MDEVEEPLQVFPRESIRSYQNVYFSFHPTNVFEGASGRGGPGAIQTTNKAVRYPLFPDEVIEQSRELAWSQNNIIINGHEVTSALAAREHKSVTRACRLPLVNKNNVGITRTHPVSDFDCWVAV